MSRYTVVILFCLIGFGSLFTPLNTEAQIEEASSHITLSEYKQIEGDIIKYGDVISASMVVGRLKVLHRRKGNQAVEAAVPALVYRLEKILETGKVKSEREGEFQLSLIKFLVNIGDRRAKGVLLQCLDTGSSVAKGLSKMGEGIVREIAEVLNSDVSRMRHGAAMTLVRIYELNPELFFSSDISFVKDRLVSRLNERLKMPYLYALGTFGDSSVLPILDQIANQDTVRTRMSISNRSIAAESAEKIRHRQ